MVIQDMTNKVGVYIDIFAWSRPVRFSFQPKSRVDYEL